MANIDEINEINTLLKSGSNEVAFEKMLKVLRNSPPADELATVSLMMMPSLHTLTGMKFCEWALSQAMARKCAMSALTRQKILLNIFLSIRMQLKP